MYSLSLELTDLKEKVRENITHSFIKKHLNKPIIDDDKLFVLNEIYKNTSMSRSQKQDYIVIIMLIDIALKTHDLVNGNNDENVTNKQLTVLVGDYYSGLYYYLLSKLEDVEMINKLATIIKRINEEKMILHYSDNISESEIYKSLLISETYLFTEVAKINGDYKSISFIESFLMLNRLKQEMLDENSVLSIYYQKNKHVNSNHSIKKYIKSKMNDFKIELDSSIKRLSVNYSDYIYNNALDFKEINLSQVEEG